MSDKPQPSPGPWRWAPNVPPGAFALLDAGGMRVVLAIPADDDVSPPNEADAALIASAPDMLAMLRELEWAGNEAVTTCPVCGMHPTRDEYAPGEPVPGKPGFVFMSGKRETIPGGHAAECKLSKLLQELP